jgi:hypothetical protein
LRHIVRRDTGESYQAFLTTLAQASGIETPTRAELTRLDRTRKKKKSNDEWTSPTGWPLPHLAFCSYLICSSLRLSPQGWPP